MRPLKCVGQGSGSLDRRRQAGAGEKGEKEKNREREGEAGTRHWQCYHVAHSFWFAQASQEPGAHAERTRIVSV